MIEASRAFVCVRPLTYESKEEAPFLESLFRTRNGELENTVFILLGPDGKKRLSNSGRTPDMVFGDAQSGGIEEMVETMRDVASRYKGGQSGELGLPVVKDLRRALDCAACDDLPLVVVVDEALSKRVARLAWSEEFIGRFTYVQAALGDAIDGADEGAGVVVVEPDAYGLKGLALAQEKASASDEELGEALREGLSRHKPTEKNQRSHVREGERRGIDWESEVPVTDPGIPRPGKGR